MSAKNNTIILAKYTSVVIVISSMMFMLKKYSTEIIDVVMFDNVSVIVFHLYFE
jgi:hypothetical protein